MKIVLGIVCALVCLGIIGGILLAKHWRENGKYSDIVK